MAHGSVLRRNIDAGQYKRRERAHQCTFRNARGWRRQSARPRCSGAAVSVALGAIDYRIDERVDDANVLLTRAIHEAVLRQLSAHSPFRQYDDLHSGFGTSTVDWTTKTSWRVRSLVHGNPRFHSLPSLPREASSPPNHTNSSLTHWLTTAGTSSSGSSIVSTPSEVVRQMR